jgi:uncharacterized membrane protein HdeD (DUF308 family)
MGHMKPWHLVVLAPLLGLVVGYVLRGRLARTHWLLVLLIGAVLVGFAAIAKVGLVAFIGAFAAFTGVAGAITTRAARA